MASAPISTPSRARFQRVLDAYLSANQRDRKDLLTRKARSACVQFYEATLAAAPSNEKIKADVLQLGWKVRRKTGAWPRRKGEPKGSPGPLNRMRAGQIARRQKARGYVATGWLPAVKKLGGQATGKRLVEVKNPKGSVTIDEPTPNQTRITVTNSTPGIVRVEREHHILRTGLNAGSKDMLEYLRQKRAGGSGVSVGGNR